MALGVISFALLTMLGVCIQGVQLMGRGERITVATEVGRRFLETVRAGGYGSIPAGNVTFDGRVPTPVTSTQFPPLPYPSEDNCRVLVHCEQLDAELKSVAVSVYYDGDSHITLQTYFRP